MIWFLAVVIVVLIGGVVVVALGGGDALVPAYDDRPDVRIPADRPLTGADLRGLRLTTSLRGYRPSEVDALLDRIALQLDAQPPATRPGDEQPGDEQPGDEQPGDEQPGDEQPGDDVSDR